MLNLATPLLAFCFASTAANLPPLAFEPNAGQSPSRAAFLARGVGYTLQFEPTGVEIRLASLGAAPESFRLSFGNALGGKIVLENKFSHKANYLRGSRENQWTTGVTQWSRLRYQQVYPGIDLVFYGNQRRFEYDFIVAPGSDPANIVLEFTGAKASIGADGDLSLSTATGRMVHHMPVIYQERAGRRLPIAGHYRDLGAQRVGFEIAAYDRSRPLVIDPEMQYSSYVGGKAPNSAEDIAYATATDPEGNIYVTGRTASSDFPLSGAMQSQNKGSGDAFVVKFDPTGKKVLYSTYLGGRSLEYAYAIAVDSLGQAYITGQTGSDDFPLKNAFQTKKTGLNHIFVTKLNAAGSGIVFSTYLGGETNDAGRGIALDSYGNVFVAGFTNSYKLFPTLNAMQPKHSGLGADGVLAKFGPEGQLLFSTFIGKQLEIYALAVDAEGSAYMTGTATAPGLASPGAAQTQVHPRDAFVAKVIADGSAMAYFTYIGGNGTDEGHAIAVDALRNAYVGGYAGSRDFPVTTGVVQETIAGSSDAFVTKVNEFGTAFVWSTRLGGTGVTPAVQDEMVRSIAVDPEGCVYVAGNTLSADFPSNRATQAVHGGKRDAFVAKLSAQADQVIFSTFLGGAEHDESYGLFLTPLRALIVAGQTFSANFPTQQAFSATRGANADAFLTRICDPVMFLSADTVEFAWTQGTDVPSARSFNVQACRDLTLTVSVDAEWLSAQASDPAKGITDVALTVDPSKLEPGEYWGTVTVSNPDVFFGPKTVRVRFYVQPPPPPPEQ